MSITQIRTIYTDTILYSIIQFNVLLYSMTEKSYNYAPETTKCLEQISSAQVPVYRFL